MLPFRDSKSFLTREVKLFLLAVLLLNPAIAYAGAEWASPVVTTFGYLESGMVQIGAVVVGLGVVAFGAYSAMFGNMRWERLINYVIAAIIIVAAPAAIRALVDLA
ncbi:TrbC/VIRB2 family protein [Pseudovibrio denitrificans]|uniref:TrbC/VIRB2 family protein n=1 Tax=Pseudovibrio denitrificans TaxID=258256 RepID=A0A1I7DVA7_9HYPH|nr:TrbC/VirB2 family protein [Pseudovibrio denitrificans]SFU15602.1 TrbC/VIRB2 family protein [Pseudovibrio denitrificans]